MQSALAAGTSRSKPSDLRQLWPDRYAPTSLQEVCGNTAQVDKLQTWLRRWDTNLQSQFQQPGSDGMGIFRAVLITGPPGIGKTTCAHLCARTEGFVPLELNASDVRSKRMLEGNSSTTNTALDGWMGGNISSEGAAVLARDKPCLIMDEVDGMSGGDRGGVGAMVGMVRTTRVPIICIANDRGAQKLRPLLAVTYNMAFRRPEAHVVRARILRILQKEKMWVPQDVVDGMIRTTQGDIRQVLNMLAMWVTSGDAPASDIVNVSAMGEQGRHGSANAFSITQRLLGPDSFAPLSADTLGSRMELYFCDPSIMPLFVHENYLKPAPAGVRNSTGDARNMRHLDLLAHAARSISDGDLVDSLIHGSEQCWSLMPVHAVCSVVRPASFVYGTGIAYDGGNSVAFPRWLGYNSKQSKLARQLVDIHAAMRADASGDRQDMRLYYIPALLPHLVQPLIDDGTRGVDTVIRRMDDCAVSREHWDAIVEMGVGPSAGDDVLKRIPSSVKAAFTKRCRTRRQSEPSGKRSAVVYSGDPTAATATVPDSEEILDMDDEVFASVEDQSEVADDVPQPVQSSSARASPRSRARSKTGPRGRASTRGGRLTASTRGRGTAPARGGTAGRGESQLLLAWLGSSRRAH